MEDLSRRMKQDRVQLKKPWELGALTRTLIRSFQTPLSGKGSHTSVFHGHPPVPWSSMTGQPEAHSLLFPVKTLGSVCPWEAPLVPGCVLSITIFPASSQLCGELAELLSKLPPFILTTSLQVETQPYHIQVKKLSLRDDNAWGQSQTRPHDWLQNQSTHHPQGELLWVLL